MMAYLRWGVCLGGLLGLLTLAGCKEDNKLEPGQPMPCTTDGECTEAGKSVCDLSPDVPVCVQCTPEKASACEGTTPVCGGDSKACRGCSAHAECTASAVCEVAGSCADAGKVLYAATNGTGMTCTKDTPCSLSEALSKVTATQNIIKLGGGTFMTNINLDGNMRGLKDFTITVLAEPGTKLQAMAAGNPVLHLRNAAKMSLFDVELGGSTTDTVRLETAATLTLTRGKVVVIGGTVAVAVDNSMLTLEQSEISGGSMRAIFVEKAASQVAIQRTTVRGSIGPGIAISNGTVRVEQSQILMNSGAGIDLADGELVLSRSIVSKNSAGGIVIGNNRKATITNNFIVGNTSGGGISALQISADSKIDFNTIVDNVAGAGASSAGGIVCDRTGLNLTGNIVFRNNGGPDTLVQEFGDCTYNGSLVLPGNGAMEQRPTFISLTDYHLTADAPGTVRNVAGVTCSGVDYDGDTRPLGGACELGADEIKQ